MTTTLHCVSKNVTPSAYFDIHQLILMIFGRNVADKAKILFLPHLISASALPGAKGNPEIVPFHLNAVCCFANKHTTHSNYQLKLSPLTW